MFSVLVSKATGQLLQRMLLEDSVELSTLETGEVFAVECTSDIFKDFRKYYFEEAAFVAIPVRPAVGYLWDPATKAWTGDLLEAARIKKLQLISEYKRQKELPLTYDAKTLDTGDEAREQLMFKAFEFAERARLNQPASAAARVWENADNTFFTFDTDQQFRNWLGGVVITLSNRTAQQRIALRQHMQNIKALTTVEDIIAYDITVGWPP